MVRSRAVPVGLAQPPAPVQAKVEPGDVITRVPSVELGEVTACAIGITGEIGDFQYMAKIESHARELPLGCTTTTITAADQVVLIEVPPIKRMTGD